MLDIDMVCMAVGRAISTVHRPRLTAKDEIYLGRDPDPILMFARQLPAGLSSFILHALFITKPRASPGIKTCPRDGGRGGAGK